MCNDDHLTSIDVNSGYFADKARDTKFYLSPGTRRACNPSARSGVYAFGYPIFTKSSFDGGEYANQGHVIVLCKGYEGAVLDSNPRDLGFLQTPGADYSSLTATHFGTTMTVKILHEIIHAADPINQCQCCSPIFQV